MPGVYIEGTGYFIQHIAKNRYYCIRDSLPLCMLLSFFGGKAVSCASLWAERKSYAIQKNAAE